MLDKLCADFPDSPRNFYSRLAQAEILLPAKRISRRPQTLRGNHQQLPVAPRNTPRVARTRRLRTCPAHARAQRRRDFRAHLRTPRKLARHKGRSRVQMRLRPRTRGAHARSKLKALGHGAAAPRRKARRRRGEILGGAQPLRACGQPRSRGRKARRPRGVRTHCKIQTAVANGGKGETGKTQLILCRNSSTSFQWAAP